MATGDTESDGTDWFVTFVDGVLPLLTPYQAALYGYLLRQTHLRGVPSLRIGFRSIGVALGKSSRASRSNYQHIKEQLAALADQGWIRVGDTTRLGTLYTVTPPDELLAVREMLAAKNEAVHAALDYYTDADLRTELFERDEWECHYCGDSLTFDSATLDHVIPVTKGGLNLPENLVAACLTCNSINSGRTYEEAAPLLLGGWCLSPKRRKLPQIAS